jgi:hypothetical protein
VPLCYTEAYASSGRIELVWGKTLPPKAHSKIPVGARPLWRGVALAVDFKIDEAERAKRRTKAAAE